MEFISHFTRVKILVLSFTLIISQHLLFNNTTHDTFHTVGGEESDVSGLQGVVVGAVR